MVDALLLGLLLIVWKGGRVVLVADVPSEDATDPEPGWVEDGPVEMGPRDDSPPVPDAESDGRRLPPPWPSCSLTSSQFKSWN